MDKKDRLIQALEKEAHQFAVRGQETADHDAALAYLKTGKIDTRLSERDHELWDACINDYETVLKDYGVE